MRSTCGASTKRRPPGPRLVSITMPSKMSASTAASTCCTSPTFSPPRANTATPGSSVRYEAGSPGSYIAADDNCEPGPQPIVSTTVCYAPFTTFRHVEMGARRPFFVMATVQHDRERELYREVSQQVTAALPEVEVLALEITGRERFRVYVDHPAGVDHALC